MVGNGRHHGTGDLTLGYSMRGCYIYWVVHALCVDLPESFDKKRGEPKKLLVARCFSWVRG